MIFIKLKLPWQYDPYSDPPLGTLSVISEARKDNRVHVKFNDLAHEKLNFSAGVYAFSASTLEYPEAEKKAKEILDKNPQAKIMAGGPHFDVFPEAYWKEHISKTPFHIICRGEGEYTIHPALDHVFAYDSKKVISQKGPLLNLDLLNLPARDILDKEKYFQSGKTFGKLNPSIKGNSSTIMTSRGCPYPCSFCASPTLHSRKLRFRSLENTMLELDTLKNNYNINTLRWQDDCVPLNLKKFPELSDYLHINKIYSRGSARTDQVDPKMLNLLEYASFKEIGFGIESAENNVLDLMKKKITVDQNEKALIETKKAGFITRAFIMTGLPGESKDSAKKMIDFLEKTNPDVVTLTSFIPLPGCDIYNNPQNYGVTLLTKDWSKYDIALKWDAGTEWSHRLESVTLDEMEKNREILKEYLFNKGKSNVPIYNKKYKSKVL